MKLLLTSGGIANPSITRALTDLVDKPIKDANVAFIPTAGNVEEGDKGWLINDLVSFKDHGFAAVDIVDISALSKEMWLPRLEVADVIVVGGGVVSHLFEWFEKSGLLLDLPKLLKSRVYVGISAGSIVTAPPLSEEISRELYADAAGGGLGYVNFRISPHLNSPAFPLRNLEWIKAIATKVPEQLYALDDQSAIVVTDSTVEIVSEGRYWTKGEVKIS